MNGISSVNGRLIDIFAVHPTLENSPTVSSPKFTGQAPVSIEANLSSPPAPYFDFHPSLWAMTYSPYTSDGACNSPITIMSDIITIASKGFSTVRLYSTDCDVLHIVGVAAGRLGLKLIIGMHVPPEGIPHAVPQVNEIKEWVTSTEYAWSLVEMIVIGNDAIFNEYCTATELAAFMNFARGVFEEAGYDGPITTAEPYEEFARHSAIICPEIDLLASNIHPFFNTHVEASMAGALISKELIRLSRVCEAFDKSVRSAVNLETGWPHAGKVNGAAIAGPKEQEIAIKSIIKAAGRQSVLSSWADEAWRLGGDYDDLGIEGYWGCGHLLDKI